MDLSILQVHQINLINPIGSYMYHGAKVIMSVHRTRQKEKDIGSKHLKAFRQCSYHNTNYDINLPMILYTER